MVIARRNLMAGKALPYLRRVAYLQSHGTEYIDTGIVYGPEVNFEMKAMIVAVKANGCILGQSYDFSWSNTNPAIAIVTTSLDCYAKYGNSSSTISARTTVGNVTPFIVTFEGSKITIDSKSADITRVTSWLKPLGNMRLFDRGMEDYSNDAKSIARIYYVKFGSESSFIPVLDLSGRPAMYDEVSGQFFYNKGTGEFTWGELET